jgi:hypothetical protein
VPLLLVSLVALSLEQDQRQPLKTVPKETRLQHHLSRQAVPSQLIDATGIWNRVVGIALNRYAAGSRSADREVARARSFAKTDGGVSARFKLTASALPDARFSDGGRAGTKPNGFEFQLPQPQPFRKGSPARREEARTTMRAQPCPTRVRIRESSYSSSSNVAVQEGPGQVRADNVINAQTGKHWQIAVNRRVPFPGGRTVDELRVLAR